MQHKVVAFKRTENETLGQINTVLNSKEAKAELSQIANMIHEENPSLSEKLVRNVLISAITTAIVEVAYGVHFDLWKVYEQSNSQPSSHNDTKEYKGPELNKDMIKHTVFNMLYRIKQRSITLGLNETISPLFGSSSIEKLTGTAASTILATLLISPADYVKTVSAVNTSNGNKTSLLDTTKQLFSANGFGGLLGTLPSLISRNTLIFLQSKAGIELANHVDGFFEKQAIRVIVTGAVVGAEFPIKADFAKTSSNAPATEYAKGIGSLKNLSPFKAGLEINSIAWRNADAAVSKSRQTGSETERLFMKLWPYKTKGWKARVFGVGGSLLFTTALMPIVGKYVPDRPLSAMRNTLSNAHDTVKFHADKLFSSNAQKEQP